MDDATESARGERQLKQGVLLVSSNDIADDGVNCGIYDPSHCTKRIALYEGDSIDNM